MLKGGHIQEQDVKGCQIFNFEIPVETSENRTDEEKSSTLAFNEGFLNLPAPKCIFVGNLKTTRKGLIPTVFKLAQSDEQGDIEVTPFHGTRSAWLPSFKMQKCHPTTSIQLDVSDVELDELKRTYDLEGDHMSWQTHGDEILKCAYALFHTFVTVSLGRLITDGIEQEEIIPSEKLNKKRISRGYPEMVSHTVVKLKPCRPPMGRSGSQGEYFTPKRYHFRRGHVRHFKNGQKTWVRSCFVGDISQGRVEHQYKILA